MYIGAISVLILFAIMLTQDKAAPSRLVFQTQAAPAAVAAIVIAVLVAVAAAGTDWGAVGELVGVGDERHRAPSCSTTTSWRSRRSACSSSRR